MILALGDRPVRDEETFVRHVGQTPVSRPVALEVRRGGQRVAVVLTLGERPEAGGVDRDRQRLVVGGVTFANAQDSCVVVEVDPRSPLRTTYHVGQRVDAPDLVTLHEMLDK